MRVRIWLATLLALLAIPATATGHADITGIGSDLDGALRVVLSAPVESEFLTVDAPGARIRRDPSDHQALLIDGADGRDVRIGGLSQDGHPFAGSAVGAAARRDGALSIAADAAILTGLLGLLGLVAFRFGIVGPAWRSGGPRAPGAHTAEVWRAEVAAPIEGAASGWWRSCAVLVAVAGAGLVLGPVGMLRDLGRGVGDLTALLLHTRWGLAWQLEMLAVAAFATVAGVFRRSRHAHAADPPRGWGMALTAPLGCGLVATAISSHASSGTDAGLGVALDTVHLATTAVWLGGLIGLLVMVPRALRPLADAARTRLAAAVIVRFSGVAIVCVALLVVTGLYRAIAELSSLGDLVHTAYGQALLVKLILFGVLLCGGAYNRLVLHPRLERAALGLRGDDAGASRHLRVSVGAELALATVLIVVVAVLVSLPPP